MDINIACCLCVRDFGKYLPQVFDNLDLLRSEFINFNAIFIYDNCINNSVVLLEQYKNKSYYKVILTNIPNHSFYRTIRIAVARNKGLSIIYKELKNIDYHIMIDADSSNTTKWDIDFIKYYLNMNSWNAISFNRSDYYDIWALMYDD